MVTYRSETKKKRKEKSRPSQKQNSETKKKKLRQMLNLFKNEKLKRPEIIFGMLKTTIIKCL